MGKGRHITLCSFIHPVNRSRYETDHPPVQNIDAQYLSLFLTRFLTQPSCMFLANADLSAPCCNFGRSSSARHFFVKSFLSEIAHFSDSDG